MMEKISYMGMDSKEKISPISEKLVVKVNKLIEYHDEIAGEIKKMWVHINGLKEAILELEKEK